MNACDQDTELAWHAALCGCDHARDQHEDDGCYGTRIGEAPCECLGFSG